MVACVCECVYERTNVCVCVQEMKQLEFSKCVGLFLQYKGFSIMYQSHFGQWSRV